MAAPSFAGGFATARMGGEHGHVATDHPSAIYFNPAGLALTRGTRIYIEGLFIHRAASYDRPTEAVDSVVPNGETGTGTPESALAANTGEAELSNFLASPFAAVVSDLGLRNVGVGVGVYVPFGGSAKWDSNLDFVGDTMFPGASDGVQRWSNIEGQQRLLYGTIAGSYLFEGANVSVGLGINLIKSDIETIRARTATGTDDLTASNGTLVEGRSLLEVEQNTMSVGLGVMWRPIEDLFLGVSYQAQPGFGETGLEGTLTTKFGSSQTTVSDVELRQELPDIFRIGFRYFATPKIEVRAAADYTRWGVFDNQCVLDANQADRKCAIRPDGGVDAEAGGAGIILNLRRNWEDTYGVRLGGSYWAADNVELVAGGSYDSSAVPDETIDAALIDMGKFVGTAGVNWGAVPGKFTVSLSYTHVAYLEREVEARGRDDMGNPDAPASPSRSPDGAGTYDQAVNLVTLGLQYAF